MPNPKSKIQNPKSRAGFSLAEIVVGAGVLAMFMAGLPWAVRMARQAVPDGANTPSATMNASRVMELMASDIAFATAVNGTAQYDPNHLTITVPDQNGDGNSETIVYACGPPPPPPPPGPPVQWLTRQFNGTTVTLLSNVQEFNFTYDTFGVTAPPGTNQAGNTLLASISGGSSYGQATINDSSAYAQFVQPTLPSNAVSWNLQKVRFQMLKNANGALAVVQVRPAVGGLPSNTVLGQVTVNNFPNQVNWQDINFNNVNGISAYSGICVVVMTGSGNAACTLQYCNNSTNSGGFLSSSDGGNTWTQNTANDFQIMVYGAPNVPGGGSTTSYYLNDVRVKLRTNQNNQSRIVTTIRTYNQPQVPHQ